MKRAKRRCGWEKSNVGWEIKKVGAGPPLFIVHIFGPIQPHAVISPIWDDHVDMQRHASLEIDRRRDLKNRAKRVHAATRTTLKLHATPDRSSKDLRQLTCALAANRRFERVEMAVASMVGLTQMIPSTWPTG